MFRRCACIALAVMLVGLSTAQAADTTLTLACQGASKTDAKPEPISMSIIVNFTARIVTGFADDDHPVKITRFDNVYISFSGSDKSDSWRIEGSIDRVTGDTVAISMRRNPTTGEVSSLEYTLKCRPAGRMF
jgi:hypothetical protein